MRPDEIAFSHIYACSYLRHDCHTSIYIEMKPERYIINSKAMHAKISSTKYRYVDCNNEV